MEPWRWAGHTDVCSSSGGEAVRTEHTAPLNRDVASGAASPHPQSGAAVVVQTRVSRAGRGHRVESPAHAAV